MEINDEWYYSELLDLLKRKEIEKDELYYQQIVLELPSIEPQPIGDKPQDDEQIKNRGVFIINF